MEKTNNPYEILLYYIYIDIQNPEELQTKQKILCEQLGLTGRIIISTEGLNGTVGGLKENTQKYVDACAQDKILKDMEFKRSEGVEDAFPKLSIKVRNEIVSSRLREEDVNPNQLTGKRLKPEDLKKWFEEHKDFAIVDMRNSYEFDFGNFEGSIDPKMRRFEDLPKKIDELAGLKNKTVLTVCTGGVRCEKASGYLVQKGFKDVYQLDGGIVSYMEKYPGQDFNGSLFVFDKRQVMHFNGENHKPISKCIYCKNTSERFKNCKDSFCNAKLIACEDCVEKGTKRLCPECENKLVTN